VLAVVVCFPLNAFADLVAVADTGGIRITLYDDPCELKEVSNLPHKATWEERGKVFKGCWNAHPGGFVVTYWLEDRTVGIVPGRVFTKANGV
jgi:uncharacterized cupin superfamily protein